MTSRTEDILTYLTDNPWSTSRQIALAFGLDPLTLRKYMGKLFREEKVIRTSILVPTLREFQMAATMAYALPGEQRPVPGQTKS